VSPKEDDRRLHRERDRLIAERGQHVNRIKGLCAIHGIYDYEPMRRDRMLRLEHDFADDEAQNALPARSTPKRLEVRVMLKFILSAALVTALSSAAFAQLVGEQTGVNSALGIAPKTEDFIKEAATSDMLEMDAAKIAQQNGNADEKQFAQQMSTDHTKTSSELRDFSPVLTLRPSSIHLL
jgi:hypothetical protein